MTLLKKIWKESASLIICGRNENSAVANGANYKILVMKRSSRASFMPNFIVFPGGAIETADSRPDWLNSFRSLGVPEQRFEVLRTAQKRRPFIFDHRHPIHRGDGVAEAEMVAIDRNISLRLSAIRETFEEVGILIGKSPSAQQSQTADNKLSETHAVVDAKRWQNEVHTTADKFHELCTAQRIVPDLWALYEWSDWLTPTLFGKKRFDTAFYLTTLHNQPSVLAETNEVQEFMWASPGVLLRMYAANEVEFAPPQFYELCRLSHIADIDELQRFASERQQSGTTLFYPLLYRSRDGAVFIYPGDDLYPTDPDYEADAHDVQRFEAMGFEEMRSCSTRVHRMEHVPRKLGGMRTVCTVEQANGHLSPVPCAKHRL